MPTLLLFNKPYGVICQFSVSGNKPTLKDYIPVPDVYPAGRLDTDSEGLLVLTDDGRLQSRITDPHHKLSKTYWVQVEGSPTDESLDPLRQGLDLGDFTSQAAQAKILPTAPTLWRREPPVRFRQHIPTQWLEITLSEGKNRQIRRMTAKIGFPTLRLVRVSIGPWSLGSLTPGQWKKVG